MSKTEDTTEVSVDNLFEQQAKALFDHSVDGLDGQTRSRLNRGRQAALAERHSAAVGFGRLGRWVPATGVAAAALVAVALWSGNPPTDPITPAVMSDFELLIADDSFEMLQDLEFYSWIDSELDNEAGPDADVG